MDRPWIGIAIRPDTILVYRDSLPTLNERQHLPFLAPSFLGARGN